MYLDRFEAASGPGVIVVHGFGNVFERTLAEGETIHVEPGGFLYKDASVTMEVIVGRPRQLAGHEQGRRQGRRRPRTWPVGASGG